MFPRGGNIESPSANCFLPHHPPTEARLCLESVMCRAVSLRHQPFSGQWLAMAARGSVAAMPGWEMKGRAVRVVVTAVSAVETCQSYGFICRGRLRR